jgi:hypothetical protein
MHGLQLAAEAESGKTKGEAKMQAIAASETVRVLLSIRSTGR